MTDSLPTRAHDAAPRIPAAPPTPARPASSPALPAIEAPVLAWDDLAGSHSHLFIHYQGQVYQLRATRNGKLILTK